MVIASFALPSLSFAGKEPEDLGKKCEGKYFTIYYQSDEDLFGIIQKIDISPSQYLMFNSNSSKADPRINLTKTIDALFLEVSDILDMHIYSFQGDIRIYRNFDELKKFFSSYFNQELQAPSFYIHNSNTICIDAENLNACILGHEIAHAIISHYFVVLPPMKIQEILAGYVEYQLKKTILNK